MVVIGKPSTPDGLPKKIRDAFVTAQSHSRQRLRKGGIYSQTLMQQQRQYRGKHWELYLSCVSQSTVPEKDGTICNVIDWYKFALTIITELEEKYNGEPAYGNPVKHGGEWENIRDEWEDWCYANTILEALENGTYIEDEYGEWHHMNALCMYGANEDWKQWVCLPYLLHVRVHRAYVHFFPNSMSMLHSLQYTAIGRGGRGGQTRSLDLETLDDPDILLELEETRKQANAMLSKQMQGKRIALKPYSPTKQEGRESKHRGYARRKLEANGEEVPDNLKKRKGVYVSIVYSGSPRDDKLAEQQKLNSIRIKLNKTRDKENPLRGSYTQEELDMFEELQGSEARYYTV